MSRPQGWSSFRNSRLLHVGAGRHQAGNAPFPPVAGMLTVAPCGGGRKRYREPRNPGRRYRGWESENAGTAAAPRTLAPTAGTAPTASWPRPSWRTSTASGRKAHARDRRSLQHNPLCSSSQRMSDPSGPSGIRHLFQALEQRFRRRHIRALPSLTYLPFQTSLANFAIVLASASMSPLPC